METNNVENFMDFFIGFLWVYVVLKLFQLIKGFTTLLQ